MEDSLKLFHYRVVTNKTNKTLFLFHGTGGSEMDLFPLVDAFKKTHNIVGLLGNTPERGMARFFKRHGEGIFDQESIKEETQKLAKFIEAWVEKYNISNDDITFIGYSNGANFIIATMFYYPGLIKKAVLLHPMSPFTPEESLKLDNHKVLISYGTHDPMVSVEQSQALVEEIKKYGATVTGLQTHDGHGLTKEEVDALIEFVKNDN